MPPVQRWTAAVRRIGRAPARCRRTCSAACCPTCTEFGATVIVPSPSARGDGDLRRHRECSAFRSVWMPPLGEEHRLANAAGNRHRSGSPRPASEMIVATLLTSASSTPPARATVSMVGIVVVSRGTAGAHRKARSDRDRRLLAVYVNVSISWAPACTLAGVTSDRADTVRGHPSRQRRLSRSQSDGRGGSRLGLRRRA